MKLIPLTQGQFAKVDDADFENIRRFKWYAYRDRNDFYARRNSLKADGGKRRTLLLHRELLGAVCGDIVDHENHDTLDCRRNNIRVCTHAQNMANRRGAQSNSQSGVRGVGWDKCAGLWRAYIVVAGKTHFLGYYKNKFLAKAAYVAANIKYFGAFGGLNGNK